LRAHWGAIAAMDFFTVEVVTWTGLVRYHVLFVIDLASRRLEIAGITEQPHEARSVHKADGAQPHGRRRRLPPQASLHHHGSGSVVLSQRPRHAQEQRGDACAASVAEPKLKGLRERWIGSARRECLDKVIPLG
jgi:hypothetical protein